MFGRTVIDHGVVPTLCRQCDMRCGIHVHIKDGRIEKLTGAKPHVASGGRVCAKALAAADLVYHPDRLRKPLKKQPDGSFASIGYHRAMDEIAASMEQIKSRYDARAVGVWTGEAIGFLQQEAYARRFIHAFGSPNYFSAESVCYASRHIAYHLVQGFYNPCPDFENARTIVLWGANLRHTHPPYMWAIERARRNGARLIVIDPRRSSAAKKSDLWLQLHPGTDAALAWGLVRRMIETGGYDRQFVDNYAIGFEAFAKYARSFTADVVENETGIPAAEFLQFAQTVMEGGSRVANYTGISLEHQTNGMNTVRIIAMLNGLCGAVDTPGGDLWPLPLPLRDLTLYDELPLEDRDPVGRDCYPALYDFRRQCHSMKAMDYMLGQGRYPLRGLVITGANPVLSNPNARKVSRAFGSLDLLVVRDLFLTATARHAHYVLPAASFLERSELHGYPHHQTINLTNKILHMPGVTDEYTFWRDLAEQMNLRNRYFPWETETEVNNWLLEPSGQSLETMKHHPEGYVYAPLTFHKYRSQPFPTPSGKFEFSSKYLKKLGQPELPVYVPPTVKPHSVVDYPMVLITGARHPLFYHSRFRNIDRLNRGSAGPVVEIHQEDASKKGIKEKDLVRVTTKNGAIELTAHIKSRDDMLPGIIQIGHGWDEANVNLLTDDKDCDPISGYPNLKLVAAKISKIN